MQYKECPFSGSCVSFIAGCCNDCEYQMELSRLYRLIEQKDHRIDELILRLSFYEEIPFSSSDS